MMELELMERKSEQITDAVWQLLKRDHDRTMALMRRREAGAISLGLLIGICAPGAHMPLWIPIGVVAMWWIFAIVTTVRTHLRWRKAK